MAILYGAPLSPFVRKVAIVLEEKAIAYEWKMVRPHSDDPDFKAISVLGKIPAYRDELVGLCDSSVICAYLEKTTPSPALYPKEPAPYAKALWIEEYFDSVMIKPMTVIYAEGFSNQKFFGKAPDLARRAAAEAELAQMFTYLEAELGSREWVVEDAFSIADISMAVGFANLRLAGYTLDANRFPMLSAHLARVSARKSSQQVTKAMDEFISAL